MSNSVFFRTKEKGLDVSSPYPNRLKTAGIVFYFIETDLGGVPYKIRKKKNQKK